MTKENSLLGGLAEGNTKNKVILNLIQDLQRMLFRNGDNNGRRGRCQIKFGMTPMGFTLIELLVVVLIIGILAAVALPQYQKAVAKSRFIQLQTTGDAISKSQQLYFLANATYATSFEDMAILPPGTLGSVGGVANRKLTVGNTVCFFNGAQPQIICYWQIGTTSTALNDEQLSKSQVPVWAYMWYNSDEPVKMCRGYTPQQRNVCQAVGGTYWQTCGGANCINYKL